LGVASGETPKFPKIYQHYVFYTEPGPFLELTTMLVDEVSILLKDDHIQVEENVALVWRPWPDNYYHRVSYIAHSLLVLVFVKHLPDLVAPAKLGNYYYRTAYMHMQVVESLFNYQLSCTYLKLCTHASVTSQLTAIFTDKPRQFLPMDWESNFPAVYEAPKCYTKDFLELHLPRSLNQVRRCCDQHLLL